jgi:hypothetical protein
MLARRSSGLALNSEVVQAAGVDVAMGEERRGASGECARLWEEGEERKGPSSQGIVRYRAKINSKKWKCPWLGHSLIGLLVDIVFSYC